MLVIIAAIRLIIARGGEISMIVLTTSRVCSSKPPLSGCSENAMAAIDDEKIHIEKRSVIERNTIIQIVLNFIWITFPS